MKVLAIDQSYTSAGIVVIENGEMIFYERYCTDKDEDEYNRARQLAVHIQLVAKKYVPDVIALEGLSFGSRGNVTRNLAGLLFAIIIFLREDGRDAVVVAPTTVKKFATGKGNNKKEAMIAALPDDVRKKFDELGVKKTTGLGDLADAFWIGKYAENTF